MKVILMQDLRHTGTRGEIVNVKPGFARNFLFPNGFALEATDGNMKLFEHKRQKIEEQHQERHEAAVTEASKLDGIEVTIAKRAGESETLYGSVTAAEVAEALEKIGVHIDRRRIDLEGGIKALGEYPVRIEVDADVMAELKVHVVAEE